MRGNQKWRKSLWNAYFCHIIVLLYCLPAAANPFEDILSATVRVIVGGRSSTGFIVVLNNGEKNQKYLLITAAHQFEGVKEQKSCNIVFRVLGEGNQVKRMEKSVPIIDDGGKPLWIRHPKLDVALLPIEPPENAILKPFQLQQIASSELVEQGKIYVGQDVYIPCYPVKIESNPMGWAILRRGIISSHPLKPAQKNGIIFVDYSTFGGDSGAPVVAFVDGKPIIVGIVVGMMRQTDVSKMPFEERIMHTPINLAIVVQAHFVLEIVEKWLKIRTKDGGD